MSTIGEFLKSRNRALRTLDIEWARKQVLATVPASDEVLLISLHKARYECLSIGDKLRYESATWLRSRGYGRFTGGELLPPGELPT